MARDSFLNRKVRVKRKIRRAISGRPRLVVFRSNKFVYAQIIDDSKGKTLVAASERELAEPDRKKTKMEKASLVGEILAKKARAKKISKVVFDRSGYKYHGRVAALAEAAREGGLEF